ncbi:MAG: prepilin-type N-terminal cleavage/methylation domain-containing protein [Planctomycetota bacterium]
MRCDATPSVREGGLTLIELLVVLAILAAVSVVAVRGLDGIQDQRRFERSEAIVAATARVIVGEDGTEDAVSNFLEDVGRLPAVAPGGDAPLRELWERPAGLASSHLAFDTIDPEISLAVGWRGPYVRREPGDDTLRDGWGNPLVVETAPGLWRIVSRGADGLPDGAGYATDLDFVVIDAATGVDESGAEISGSVLVSGLDLETPWTVTVLAYGPDPTSGEILARAETPDHEQVDPTAHEPADAEAGPIRFDYSFSGTNALTRGRRVFRAYAHPVGQDPRTTAFARSVPVRLRLRRGAQNLDLRIGGGSD